MSKYILSLILSLSVVSIQQFIVGMDVPQFQTKELLKGNEARARAAAARKGLQEPLTFKLLVMHPTPRLVRTDNVVEAHRREIEQLGYTINPKEKRHLTLMTWHVPFTNWQVDCPYAKEALSWLWPNVENSLGEFADINFTFTHFGTLMNEKHLVAFYDFATPQDRQKFYAVYDRIVREYLKRYPNAWMSVPYEFKPHVTVATRKGLRANRSPVELLEKLLLEPKLPNRITLGYRKTVNDPRSPLIVALKGPGRCNDKRTATMANWQ